MPKQKTGSSTRRRTAPASTRSPHDSSTSSSTIETAPCIVIKVPALPPTSNHIWVHTRGNHFRTAEYDAWILEVMRACRGKRPKKPLTGPLKVVIAVGFAKMSTHDRSDLDNRIKATLDALAHAKIYENDSQIVDIRAAKFVTGKDETDVRVTPFLVQ